MMLSSSSTRVARSSNSRRAVWCTHSATRTCWLFVGVLLACLSSSVHVVYADCPATGCGPSGACILDERSCGDSCEESCKCEPGFAGSDCSFQAVTCPGSVGPEDVQTCFNGGTCREQEEAIMVVGSINPDTPKVGEVWRCNCQSAAVPSAVASAKIVAGHQCEFVSQRSCEVGRPDSSYAFCVNEGSCLRMTRKGQPHKGCLCNTDFEGRHCQYKKGTMPASELAYLKEQGAIADEASESLSGVALFFIILLALGAFGGVGFVLYQHYQHKSGIEMDTGSGNIHGKSPVIPEDDHDLQLDEASGDGERNGDKVDAGGDGDDNSGEPMHAAEII